MSELSYSLHLGSDKNRKPSSKNMAKAMHLVLLLYQTMQFKMLEAYQELINIITVNMIITLEICSFLLRNVRIL